MIDKICRKMTVFDGSRYPASDFLPSPACRKNILIIKNPTFNGVAGNIKQLG
jgi:hypothetical protein